MLRDGPPSVSSGTHSLYLGSLQSQLNPNPGKVNIPISPSASQHAAGCRSDLSRTDFWGSQVTEAHRQLKIFKMEDSPQDCPSTSFQPGISALETRLCLCVPAQARLHTLNHLFWKVPLHAVRPSSFACTSTKPTSTRDF